MSLNQEKEGIIYASLSYMLWGFIPIYWKFLDHIGALEILAQRVLWSFVFMLIILTISKKFPAFFHYVKEISKNPKKLLTLIAASLFVTANWGIFIWAVNDGRILETSLGYYINPLISIILGVTVLKERLNKLQVTSVFLAAIGVIILTAFSGQFPWVSLALALSFGLYGLAKALIRAEAAIGLTLETLMILPVALCYILYIFIKGESMFLPLSNSLLMMGGGIATALPLLLFAIGANKIPLSMLGFLQYIAPTISLFVGVFMYGEAFTKVHALAFCFIWSALILFSYSQMKIHAQLEGHLSGKVEA